MLYHGTLASSMSGSLNGSVFSHNRGGPYARARTVPIDPQTDEQLTMREAMGDLASDWRNTLTQDQREAWADFARRNRHPNRIGDLRQLTGRAEFFRANLARTQSDLWLASTLGLVEDPSPIGPSCEISPTFAPAIDNAVTADFLLTWDDTEEWALEAGAGLLWYCSDVQEPVINWFRSPYTLGACCTVATAGTLSVTLPALAPIASGKRLFWRARITRADGRISMPWTGKIET